MGGEFPKELEYKVTVLFNIECFDQKQQDEILSILRDPYLRGKAREAAINVFKVQLMQQTGMRDRRGDWIYQLRHFITKLCRRCHDVAVQMRMKATPYE